MDVATTGERLGKYLLGREIGRGAAGTVYEAVHEGLGKAVAVKRMHAYLASDPHAAERFLREGRAAARIASEHVVQVFDVGVAEGVPYLVMERLEGQTLADRIRRERIAPAALIDLMLPVIAAIGAAHRAGVVHRDLKPSNVFLAERGEDALVPVVLDFGISKVEHDAPYDLTGSEVILGTVHYLSPEQTRGARNATTASDQYALGVMLYEGLTGAKPFSGNSPYTIMHAIVSARVAPPGALAGVALKGLDHVVLRAMARDPRDRFGSVDDLARALLPWASPAARTRYAAALSPANAPANASAWRAKAPARARGWGCAALVLAGAAALAVRHELRPTSATPAREAAALTGSARPVSPAAPLATAPDEPARPPPVPAATGEEPGASPAPVRRARRGPDGQPARPERGINGALILE